MQLAETEGAVACFRKAMELRPSSAVAVHNLALILESIGDRQGAIDAVQVGLKSIDDADLHALLGCLFVEENRLGESRHDWAALFFDHSGPYPTSHGLATRLIAATWPHLLLASWQELNDSSLP